MDHQGQLLAFHHIQKSIILSLAHESPLRFRDLQPPRVPNNTFSYHLKKLLDTGYIELTDEGYRATRKALKHVMFAPSQTRETHTLKLISMVYVTNDLNEVLLINRSNQPFQGWYGIPSGLIHANESSQECAKRELKEKANLEIEAHALRPVGVIEFKYEEKGSGDVFVQAIAFIYSYNYIGDRRKLSGYKTKYGQLSWSKFGRPHILPEVETVREMVYREGFQHKVVKYEEPSDTPVLTIR